MKNKPILIIFATKNAQESWHKWSWILSSHLKYVTTLPCRKRRHLTSTLLLGLFWPCQVENGSYNRLIKDDLKYQKLQFTGFDQAVRKRKGHFSSFVEQDLECRCPSFNALKENSQYQNRCGKTMRNYNTAILSLNITLAMLWAWEE